MSENNSFTNLHISEERLVSGEFEKRKESTSIARAFILLLAIALLCTVVGVAVYFGTRCKDAEGSSEAEKMTQRPQPSQPSTTMPYPTTHPASLRLPTNLKPLHYNVLLRPDIYQSDTKDFMCTGHVEIYVEVQTQTNMITVHSKALTIQNDAIKVKEVSTMEEIMVNTQNVKLVPNPHEFLEIPLKDTLQENKTYVVEIHFSGPINKDLRGIYYSDYVNDNGETVYLLTSQMQPTDARKTFPCMDEPALKATFNVTIERKEPLMSKSNTDIYSTDELDDGWFADHYETTPLMSTYLLAFLVSDFQCVSNHTSTGNLVEVCARPNAIHQTAFAMSIAVDLQEWFEWYYNVSYPLRKMTHVAVPDFAAGAMENWGLIVYRETALLYEEGSSASAKERVAIVVSHELAHQWFGNLVTPDWWDDIWLNEGFASYMERLGVDHVKDFNTWHVEKQFVVTSLQYVFTKDSLASSHPIYQPVNDPAEIYSIFDAITYYKGAAVIRMMKYFLGEKTFRWGISNYLKNRLYKAADHRDLFSFLTQQSTADGKMMDIQAIMNTWILQMGYPVVTFNFSMAENRIELSQTHFLTNRNQTVTRKSDYGYMWIVPVSYMTDKTGAPDLEALNLTWLNTSRGYIENIAAGSNWIIGNVGETFFYRCNYNQENWNALIDALKSNHTGIPVDSRVQILDDAFQLGRSNYIDQTVGMKATLYMDNEEEYTPWYVIVSNMAYIRRMLYQTEGTDLLKTYMQKQLVNIYNKLGWMSKPTDSHRDEYHRSLIISAACTYGLPECKSNATALYQGWMDAEENNGTYSIDGNVLTTVLCHAIANGGVKEWDFGHKMLKMANSGAMRQSLLAALGCSTEPWILQRYLEYALAEDDYGIRQQDMRDALRGVARNTIGTHIAWNFFKSNWDIFYERFGEGSFTMASMIADLTMNLSTEWELEDLKKFMADHPEQGTGAVQFIQSVESIIANIKWRETNEENIIEWLKQNA